MAHHHCLSIVLFDLVGVTHLVHAYNLPVVAFPEDGVERAQKHLYMVLLWSHIADGSSLGWNTNPLIDVFLKPDPGVIPLIPFLFFAPEKCLYLLCAGNWLIGLLLARLLRLFTEISEVQVAQPTH